MYLFILNIKGQDNYPSTAIEIMLWNCVPVM